MAKPQTATVQQKVLSQTFGYDGFRPGQEEIIKCILSGEDTLAVMPTGAGKSLCYQVPALIMDGTCLIISPLIALMQDQVAVLKEKGVAAEYIASGMQDAEVRSIYSRVSLGEVKMLYVSPERLKSEWFRNFVSSLDISFIAIDEAHCISEWGHDFRPSYRLIGEHLQVGKAGSYRLAAFTATATAKVREDICSVLQLTEPRVFVRGFDRPNLTYDTEFCSDKKERISELIKSIKEGSSIVYCGSRKRVEEVYEHLKQQDLKPQMYHAGLADKLREKNQNEFLTGGCNIMIATNAFGMGIDKKDVRLVIHHDMPSTVESYYQEAGRAGRDGKDSRCILLYKQKDERLQEFFINCTYPEKSSISKLWRAIRKEISEGRPETLIRRPYALAASTDEPFATVTNVISLLERNEYIGKSRTPTKAKVKFDVPIEDLRQLDRDLADRQQKECLRAIVRCLPSSAMNMPCELDLISLSNKSDINRNHLRGFLGYLSANGYASVRYSGPIGQYQINPELGDTDVLPLDYQQLAKQKNRSLDMLSSVISYIKKNGCNKQYILDYFGQETGEICGKCSGCQGRGQKQDGDDKLKAMILKGVEITGERYGRMMVIQFLRGERTERILDKGLTAKKGFGMMSENSVGQIHVLMDQLIEERKLEVDPGKYKIVTLGPSAFDYMLDEATKDAHKSSGGAYEKALSDLSNTVAELEGISSSSFISSALMQKLSANKPAGTHELDKMGALANRWVDKYKNLIVNTATLTEKSGSRSSAKDDFVLDYKTLLESAGRILSANPNISARALREELGASFPYSTIKAVLADLR